MVIQIAKLDLGWYGNFWVSDHFPEIYKNRPDPRMLSIYWWPYGMPRPRLKYCKKILKLVQQ